MLKLGDGQILLAPFRHETSQQFAGGCFLLFRIAWLDEKFDIGEAKQKRRRKDEAPKTGGYATAAVVSLLRRARDAALVGEHKPSGARRAQRGRIVVTLPAAARGTVSSRAGARERALVKTERVDVAALGVGAPKTVPDVGALEADRVADAFALGAFRARGVGRQVKSRSAHALCAVVAAIKVADILSFSAPRADDVQHQRVGEKDGAV